MRLLSVLTLGTLLLPLSAYAADPNSHAQPEQVRMTHLDLDLRIDFPQRQVDGQATLKLDWKNPKAGSLVLDTRDLKIARVEALDADGKPTPLKNEGFTTYVQDRITEAVYGKTLAEEEALLSARALQKSIGGMPANAQKLAPDPRGIGADDALSDVAYDKGAWFLRTLEQRFGHADFDTYLKGHFHHLAVRSITTEQMLAYLRPNLIERYPGRMRWDEVKAWVCQSGIPKDARLPGSPRFAAIDHQRSAFLGSALAVDRLDAASGNTPEGLAYAQAAYAGARSGYHPLTQSAIEGIFAMVNMVNE